MRQVVFFGVAAHEREALARASFPGAACRLYAEPLDPRLAAEAEAVSIGVQGSVTEGLLARLPKLRFLTTRSTGYDHVDLAACARRGIQVANVPHYSEVTVAEHAIGLAFALAHRLREALDRTRAHDFSLDGLVGLDLGGKTLGVVGAGTIGRQVLRIARGIGMRTLAYDPAPDLDTARREGFRYVAFEELLENADVVSLHVPLTPATRHLIGAAAIAHMKHGALLINTARGAVVDERALYEALRDGRLGGVGLDVLEGEGLLKQPATRAPELPEAVANAHALLQLDNVIVTPHSAFLTRDCVQRLLVTSVENVQAYLDGRPRHLVQAPTLAREVRA